MASQPVERAPRYTDMPATMRSLPVDDRGYPVPWFVAWVEGAPVFPAMDHRKLLAAWERRLCWVCGKPLGRVNAFVIGPMCAINRVSSEPPSHLHCARFSAIHCPFLSRPKMKRQGETYYAQKGVEKGGMAGIGLDRNPGVALVWQTLKPGIFGDGAGGHLFDIGKPHKAEWYCEGRAASRLEVLDSIASGLPILVDMANRDPDPVGARAELVKLTEAALKLLPVNDRAPQP